MLSDLTESPSLSVRSDDCTLDRELLMAWLRVLDACTLVLILKSVVANIDFLD